VPASRQPASLSHGHGSTPALTAHIPTRAYFASTLIIQYQQEPPKRAFVQAGSPIHAQSIRTLERKPGGGGVSCGSKGPNQPMASPQRFSVTVGLFPGRSSTSTISSACIKSSSDGESVGDIRCNDVKREKASLNCSHGTSSAAPAISNQKFCHIESSQPIHVSVLHTSQREKRERERERERETPYAGNHIASSCLINLLPALGFLAFFDHRVHRLQDLCKGWSHCGIRSPATFQQITQAAQRQHSRKYLYLSQRSRDNSTSDQQTSWAHHQESVVVAFDVEQPV